MDKKIDDIKTVMKTDYWECPRCKNSTLKPGGTMIPCPRGSCEAQVAGVLTVTTTKKVKLLKVKK